MFVIAVNRIYNRSRKIYIHIFTTENLDLANSFSFPEVTQIIQKNIHSYADKEFRELFINLIVKKTLKANF